jgi:hypothetical protein
MVMVGSEEQLVSEPSTPARGSFDAAAMGRGVPGLPARFTWRGRAFVVLDQLETWKTSTPGKGCGELYLRRHWFRIRVAAVAQGEPETAAGAESASGRLAVFTVYCLRQPPRGGAREARRRWWLYSVGADSDEGGRAAGSTL